MKSTITLFAIMALFACIVAAGSHYKGADIGADAKKHGELVIGCVHGKKRINGKCRRAVLRVRSADSGDFFEIPHVEDVHWGKIEAENAEI